MSLRITVIGCGAGALATAADLAMRGNEITIYVGKDHFHNLEKIRETGIIRCSGKIKGEANIRKATWDLDEALEDVDLLLVVTPTNAHEEIAKSLKGKLKPGSKIILSPGSTGGALVFAKHLKDTVISEIHTLPYTVRKTGENEVYIYLIVRYLLFATFPSCKGEEIYRLANSLYPLIHCESVLETSLNNGNATTHPAPMVLNAGKIEYQGRHSHYAEGITPSVGKVIQKIDDERKNICRAFEYEELDIKERLYKMGYCPFEDTVYECIQGSTRVFLPIEGPHTLNNRYLTEDTPYSLVAMRSIASLAGVETPLMDSVIELGGALMGTDYLKTGRNLKAMGIDGMSIEELKEYLKTGERSKE